VKPPPSVLMMAMFAAGLLGACHLLAGIEEGQAACRTDGQHNGLETDVDCGGSCSNKCTMGKSCDQGSDCLSKVCDTDAGACAQGVCGDGQLNNDESDVDCGGKGKGCPRCTGGGRCLDATDCASGQCEAGICKATCCFGDCNDCAQCTGAACPEGGFGAQCDPGSTQTCVEWLSCFEFYNNTHVCM